jgi:hypothetical protein
MIWPTAIVTALLASQVNGAKVAVQLVSYGRETLESRMEEVAYSVLERRQTTDNSNNTLDPVEWDTQTTAACLGSLSSISAATNPSGMAMCYNVAQLDTTTGAFVTDLRLFSVSAPTGKWAGIPSQAMQGGVLFTGATAKSINGQTTTQSNTARSVDAELLNKRQATTPTLLRNYTIVGQINADRMNTKMTM